MAIAKRSGIMRSVAAAQLLSLKVTNARVRDSFWTVELDRRLQAYEAKGLSGAAIADRLGTTRDAVLGRSQRLRGLTLTYKAYVKNKRPWRAAAAPKRREQYRRRRVASSICGWTLRRTFRAALQWSWLDNGERLIKRLLTR